jgi:hypothetical protein
VYGDQA